MGMRAEFYFYVYGLEAAPSAFGEHGPVQMDGRDVTLDIPKWRDDYWHPDPNFAIRSAWSRKKGGEGPTTMAEVIHVRVAVDLHSDWLVSEIEWSDDGSRARYDEVSRELGEARASALTFLSRFLEWVSVDCRQSQHATAARVAPGIPERGRGEVRLYDRNGDMSEIGIHMEPSDDSPWPTGELLTRESAERILDKVREGERPGTVEQLLADAEFHAFHARDRHQGVALVLAAAACETAVKSTLPALASPNQAALVDLWLSRKVPVPNIFDVGLNAVVKKSFKKHDATQFEGIQLLFAHRNEFAHGSGRKFTDDEIRRDLTAARDALDYLDALKAGSV